MGKRECEKLLANDTGVKKQNNKPGAFKNQWHGVPAMRRSLNTLHLFHN